MDLDFWNQVWTEKRLGFDQAEANYYLRKVLSTWLLEPCETVFVPLCGRSIDMWELHCSGHHVTGVEGVRAALEDFDNKFSLNMSKSMVRDSVECFRSDDFTLYCADFFDLISADIPSGERPLKIWDRAALVALPDYMRKEYYRQVERLSEGNLDWLCLLFSFNSKPDFGPPFSVSFEEVDQVMTEKGFNVKVLDERQLEPKNPKFVEAGISEFTETLIQVTS